MFENVKKEILLQAFTEMQVNKIETSKKLKMIEMQVDLLKTSKKKYEITDKEITTLPADARVFSSVGRMFVLSTLPNVHEELSTKQTKCDEMVAQLEEKKEFLVKCSKDQEDSLRDLVQQRKEAGSSE